MKHYLKVLCVGLLGLYLTGCSSLMTVEEAAPNISLQQSTVSLTIAVLDQRPYVLDGGKAPSFEGLIRSGFGIPYSYYTATGEPMSVYLGKRLEHGFKVNGVDAHLQPTDIETSQDSLLESLADQEGKALVLSLYEWKYDHHSFSKSAFYDAEITVLDEQGNSLVNKKFNGKDSIPSGNIRNAMQTVYKARFERFFADPEILQALEH